MDSSWRETFKDILLENVLLTKYNTWGIQSRARVLLIPETLEQATALLGDLDEPYLILGRGSNVLLPDQPIARPVVVISSQLSQILWEQGMLRAQAGASLGLLSREAARLGRGGLEDLCMIPGTVGGALLMNAGAHGSNISNGVQWVRVFENGQIREYPKEELTFSYRRSSLMKEGLVILEAGFILPAEDGKVIQQKMDQARQWRKNQPGGRSAGSVFRNPPEGSAGALIDSCGLKGTRVGGAVISPIHANFILNEGNATAEDILSLISLCEEQVYRRFGVRLRKEIRVIVS